MLAILFCPFGFIAPKTLNYLAFQSFNIERTWWRLFQKRVVRTNFDIYVLVSKTSLFTSCITKIYIKIFSYANYNFFCILLLMLGLLFTILKSELSSQSLILSVTWWRFFQKHVVRTKFDIYVFVCVGVLRISSWEELNEFYTRSE